MITKEDIENSAWQPLKDKTFKECYGCMYILAQKLLKERDAYRKIAISYAISDYETPSHSKEDCIESVDAEAQKILDAQK